MVRKIVLFAILGATISGCGVGYTIDPAVIVVTDAEGLSASELRANIWPLLVTAGFDDLGRDDEMIALLRRTGAAGETVSELLHQYTYLNERRNLRVIVTDYTDMERSEPTLTYERPGGPYFEIRVYEQRPGGFSSSASQFLGEFQVYLRSLDAEVALMTVPPPTDDSEYWRITLTNLAVGVLNWLVVFAIAVAVVGGTSYAVLKRAPIRAGAKRGIFVIVNTWLATPLPFPAASILVILLPNILAIPWTDLDYYRRVQSFAVVSFPISMMLCTLISLQMFRRQSE